MAVTWRQLVGNTDRFAVEVALMPDPDEGRHASPAVAASWGQFKLFIDGKNLCESRDPSGVILDSVHWYLLPVIKFFIENWDAMLHQGRLPVLARSGLVDLSAATLMAHTQLPSPARGKEAFATWNETWWEFYSAHAITAAREGGLFPNIWFRRTLGDVEVSWNNDWNPAELPLRFVERQGEGLITASDFAGVLGTILEATLDEMARRYEAEEFAALKQLLASVKSPDTERRWLRQALLLDLRRNMDEAVALAKRLAAQAPRLLGSPSGGSFVPASLPSVVFASYSPNIAEADALAILAEFEASRTGASQSLEALYRETLCPFREPWSSGYLLALELRRKLGLGEDPVSIEPILHDLGVAVREIALSDREIRAVSFVDARDEVAPTILMNRTSSWFEKPTARAVTLAHELCHLTSDRRIGTALGIASGPWAPGRFEQRANAFAVMFLLPEIGVTDAFARAKGSLRHRIEGIAGEFGTSFIATVEHFANLGIIERHERDSLLEELGFDR